ncbi:MAG: septum formation protein Maf [Candidatus Cloacimonetes bacterium]|nr:septum formation protein Maf [Candidatus Cloacimonadota bacterium]
MLHTILKNEDIILASKSPRRAILLKKVGLKFRQIASEIREIKNEMSPEKFVTYYSQKKAEKIYSNHPNSFVIGTDTIILFNKKIIGKPKNRNEAKSFLKVLSNNSHKVITGISIYSTGKIVSDIEKTNVFFNVISDKEIDEYLTTNEPFDKAGAYGIQGFGSQFIKKIDGCYFNVMGFPISLFYQMCKSFVQN